MSDLVKDLQAAFGDPPRFDEAAVDDLILRSVVELSRLRDLTKRMSDALRDANDEIYRCIKSYEKCSDDIARLVRELDVAMHGEENVAKQASLCDLIGPARQMAARLAKYENPSDEEIERAFSRGYQKAVDDLGNEGDYQQKDWSEPYEFLKKRAALREVGK